MDCHRLRVVFAGTPHFAATALQALLDSPHEVVGVLSQPDRPAGRGRKLTASPVKSLAIAHGVPVQQPSSLREAAAVTELASLSPDVMVVAAYGLLLPATVLDLPPMGCLNIHASLLPRWRGAAPIHRALLAGDEQSGVCIMRMDEGLDTGDVLLERRVSLSSTETSASLHDTLAALGAEALIDALGGYCLGELQPSPQSTQGVTYAAKLAKGEARLDFSESAIALDRRIRAFNPWPVAETSLAGHRVRVWNSSLGPQAPGSHTPGSHTPGSHTNGQDSVMPGDIIAIEGDSIVVATGAGSLTVHELQRDGGKRVGAASLVRSLDAVGQRMGS